MNVSEHHIEDIIIRELNHTASADELLLLQEWLKSRHANREKYEDIRRIWEDSSSVFISHQFDTSKAWLQVQQKIEATPRKQSGSVIRLFPLKRMIAAAVLLLITVSGITVYFNAEKGIQSITVAATESNKKILLADGSVVFLRKGSMLSYSKSYPGENRKVDLVGEAYFEVKRDVNKPFLITTQKTQVRVLGTSFLVRSADSIEQVIVTTGKVSISDRQDPKRNIIITTGQKAELKGRILTHKNTSNANLLAWKDGVLVFRNTPLIEVIEAVNHFYQVNIMMSESVKKQAHIVTVTAQFEKQGLQQVLEELQLTTGLTLKQPEDEMILDFK